MDAHHPVPSSAQRLLSASWHVVTLFGVRVRLHWSCALVPLAAWFVLTQWNVMGTAALDLDAVLLRTALVTALYFAVVWSHELAHAMARRYSRVPVRQVTLWPLGGLGHLEHGAMSPQDEIFIGLVGPLTHAVWLIAAVVPYIFFFQGAFGEPSLVARIDYALVCVNFALLALNLLPAWPLDGGRVLRGAFALRMHPSHASLLTSYVGFAGSLVLAIAGAAVMIQWDSVLRWGAGPFLLALATWIAVGCRKLLDDAHWRPEGPYAPREARQRTVPPAAKWSLEEPTPAEPVAVEERRERRATAETQPRRRESSRPSAPPLNERIDELLDRINEVGGIEKLSDAERKELADASERLRKGDR